MADLDRMNKCLDWKNKQIIFWYRCSVKKVFLKFRKIDRKKLVPEQLFKKSCRPEAWNFIKKDTPVQVFSCEYCENFKNIYFVKHLRTAGSVRKLLVSFFSDEYLSKEFFRNKIFLKNVHDSFSWVNYQLFIPVILIKFLKTTVSVP